MVGAEYLPKSPPLLNPSGDGFNPALFDSPAEAERLVVRQEPASGPWGDPDVREQAIRDGDGRGGDGDPARPARAAPARRARSTSRSSTTASTSRARSPICGSGGAGHGGRQSIVAGRLKRDQKTQSYTEPIQVKARGRGHRAARWAGASGAGSSRSCWS